MTGRPFSCGTWPYPGHDGIDTEERNAAFHVRRGCCRALTPEERHPLDNTGFEWMELTFLPVFALAALVLFQIAKRVFEALS